MAKLRKRPGRRYNWKAVVISSWKAVFMLLLAGAMFQIQYWSFPSSDPYMIPPYEVRATTDTTTTVTVATAHDRAIFLISMGQGAASGKIVERCLLSIRRRGAWNGYVILLTDAPADRYLPSQKQDDHFIVMHPRPQDFKWGDEINDVPYKRFKMMQLNYVDLDPRLDSVDLVYYLDVDIVVGAPLQDLYDYIEGKYNILGNKRKDTSVAKAFFFTGNYKNYPVQGGQFVLERPHSQTCMDQWLTTFDRLPNITKDQEALRVMHETQEQENLKTIGAQNKNVAPKRQGVQQKTVVPTKKGARPSVFDWIFGRDKNDQEETQPEKKCELVLMEQMPHLFFPKKAAPMEEMLNSTNFVTLNHFKNTGTAISSYQKLQASFIRALLDISKEEGERLGVAKTIIFEPSAANFSVSSR
jgi:hypothetical protein